MREGTGHSQLGYGTEEQDQAMKIRNGSYQASSCQSRPLPPHRLGASLQEAHVYQPDCLLLAHSEGLTKLRHWACWEGAHR